MATVNPVEAEIIVRGEGQARAMPDRAVLRAAVEGEGSSRDDAYGEAARLARSVDDVVSGFGAVIDRAATAALVVHPKTRWKKGESVRTGWRASRTTVLEVVDLGRLGDLIAELSVAGAAISGPAWQLDPTNPVHGHVRRLAAEDARRRAEEYAAVLGLEIVAVAWVAEPGLRKDADPPGFDLAPAMMRAASASMDDVINVAPDEMTVSASVEVGFAFGPRPSGAPVA